MQGSFYNSNKMKYYLFIILFLITNVCVSQRIPIDKQQHFFIGVAVGSTASTIHTGAHPLVNTLIASSAAGIVKESYDMYHKGGVVDRADIYFTVAGGMVGGAATYFINKAIHKRMESHRSRRWL